MKFCRCVGVLVFALSATQVVAENAVREAMQDYSEFATYDAGIILPEQITKDIFDSITLIDTRSHAEFTEATIPGAIHIEWRDIFGQIDEVPTTGKVVLFCNTGTLSAQAAFGLRVLGRENVLVLQTGYHGWLENAAFRPN